MSPLNPLSVAPWHGALAQLVRLHDGEDAPQPGVPGLHVGDLGFGRIVASEKEAPNMLANMG